MSTPKRLIEAVQAALHNDGELVSAEERSRIELAIDKLQLVAQTENRRHITLAMDDLEAETKELAARRMDKSIKKALADRRVEELGNGLEAKGEQA